MSAGADCCIVGAGPGGMMLALLLAGLKAQQASPPMDVCWLRLPRLPSDGHDSGAFFVSHGRMLVCIPRMKEWQIGYVFLKGDFGQLKARGIEALREGIAATAPMLADRVSALRDQPFELPLPLRIALATPGLRLKTQ